MSSSDDLYLTAGQVAELLHVSTKTVRRWAEQGLLHCSFTLGGHRRFRLSDVESAVADPERRPLGDHRGAGQNGDVHDAEESVDGGGAPQDQQPHEREPAHDEKRRRAP